MPERLRERIRARLEALGINPFEAARRAEVERSYVNDLLIGKKSSMRQAQLAKVAQALECDPDYLIGLQSMPRMGDAPNGIGVELEGVIEPGVWREPEAAVSRFTIPFPPDPRYPPHRQHWFLVRGDSLAKIGLLDGSIIEAVDGIPARNGDVAVLRRTHATGAIQTSVHLRQDDAWAPVPGAEIAASPAVLHDDDVTLVGLVVLAFRTFGAP